MCSNFSSSLGSQVIQLQLHRPRQNMDMSWWLLWSDNKKSLCIMVSCPPEQSKVLSWGLGWIINCERQGQIQSFQDKSRRITKLYLERSARVPIPWEKREAESSSANCYHDNRQQCICVQNEKISSHPGKILIKTLPFLQANELKCNLLFGRLSAHSAHAFLPYQQLI